MASKNKLAKTDKKNHFGKGGGFLKGLFQKGKGFVFFTAAQRKQDKKIINEQLNEIEK